MIANLKPCPKMKDSGVPWLGKVPEHWDVAAIRRFSKVFAGGTPDRAEPRFWQDGSIPWLASGDVNQRRITKAHQFISEVGYASSAARWIKPGSVVIALAGQGRTKGMVATVEFSATCNQSLAVVEPSPKKVDYRFLAFYLESRYFDLRSLVGDGLRDGLNLEHVNSIPAPLPPLEEQKAIIQFLDHFEQLVGSYIQKKQKLIKLLEEQKQAIIHRAVTRGLDPSVPLKPSGVEWLGEIPQHWEVFALRRRSRIIDCKHLTVPFVPDGIPLASVREVGSFNLNLSTANRTSAPWFELLVEGGRQPLRGDLIYCRNVNVGAAAYVDTDEHFAMGQDVCLIRSAEANQRYTNYFLHSPAMKRQLTALKVGSTFDRINVSDVKNLLVLFPPRNEQDSIVDFLDNIVQEFEQSASLIQEQLDRLNDLRTRLISDVVTGKLRASDVREDGGEELQHLQTLFSTAAHSKP